MRPAVGDTWPAAFVKAMRPDGIAKFARFRTLKASRRTWSVRFDARLNPLINDRSALTRPGPVSALRGTLPRVFTAGSVNALMSQYASGLPVIGSPVNAG